MNRSRTLKWVTADFPFSTTAIFWRLSGSLPIGALIFPKLWLIEPVTMAIYFLVVVFSFNCSLKDLWAILFLHATSKPEVSLSIRWTIPELISPPILDKLLQWYNNALTNVPWVCPGAGWTTIPLGLFTTITSSSS